MQVLIDSWVDYAAVVATYILLVTTSGSVVNYFLRKISDKTLQTAAGDDEPEEDKRKKRLAAGSIIGKCENVLILSFILLEAYTALALVVTAKTLVRKDDIEKNETYFLAGTLINVSYSVLMGLFIKVVLQELNVGA